MEEMRQRIWATRLLQRKWREYKQKKDAGLLKAVESPNPFVSSMRTRQMLFKDSSIDKMKFVVMAEEQRCAIYPDKIATRICAAENNMLYSEEGWQDTHDRGYRKRQTFAFIEYE